MRAPAEWTAHHWLHHCKDAEARSGRRETYHWGPRVADADILLLGERGDIKVSSPDLVVPHAELRHRQYLHRLLGEINAPDAAIPRR